MASRRECLERLWYFANHTHARDALEAFIRDHDPAIPPQTLEIGKVADYWSQFADPEDAVTEFDQWLYSMWILSPGFDGKYRDD